MLSVQTSVFTLLLLVIGTDVSCEELTAVKKEESTLEGTSVTLSYEYKNAATGSVYFFWYRQFPGKPPEFLISHTGTGRKLLDPVPGVSIKVSKDQRQMDLQISSAAVTDSAVYYCAVSMTQTGINKLVFGSGTSLTVETTNDVKPDFYYLENPEEKEKEGICLATSFTRHNALNDTATYLEGFIGTKPTMITKSGGVYNQVAFLNKSSKATCTSLSTDEPCSTERDPILNLASLTIFGLRVIFFKTVVFNVLMTLRLWSSQ